MMTARCNNVAHEYNCRIVFFQILQDTKKPSQMFKLQTVLQSYIIVCIITFYTLVVKAIFILYT